MALQFTAVENQRKFTSKRIKTQSQKVLEANPRFREDRMSKLVTHRGRFCPPSWIGLKPIITNLRCYLTTYGIKNKHSRIARLKGKAEGISLTPHYHFHPLHRPLDISRAITTESSPVHITSNRNRTENLLFLSASQ